MFNVNFKEYTDVDCKATILNELFGIDNGGSIPLNTIFCCVHGDALIRFSTGDAGIDLSNLTDEVIASSSVNMVENVPFLVKTGVKICLPHGFYASVVPRSSLPIKMGLMISNSPGTIDSTYRGDVMLQLHIQNKETFNRILTNVNGKWVIPKHTRMGQLIIHPAIFPCVLNNKSSSKYGVCKNYSLTFYSEYNYYIVRSTEIYEKFDRIFDSERGVGGFGSTGK